MTDDELLDYSEGRWPRADYLDYHKSRVPILECQERLLELNLKRRELKEIERGVKFYSQPTICQDEWVIETLGGKKGGFFVDVGAYDGLTDSNTAMLEKFFEWQGVCVEAGDSWSRLIKNRNQDFCVRACIDVADWEVEFVSAGQLSGVVGDRTDWRECDPDVRQSLTQARLSGNVGILKTMTIGELLDLRRVPRVFDYLSLDIQGLEQPVIQTFPFQTYTPKLITLENCEPNIVEFLESNGYRFVKKVMLDGFFVHRSLDRARAC